MNRLIKTLFFLILVFPAPGMRGETTRHWNLSRGYSPFRHAQKDCLLIENNSGQDVEDIYSLPLAASDISFSFKAKNRTGKPAISYSYETGDGERRKIHNPFWGFLIVLRSDTLLFTVTNEEIPAGIESLPATVVRVTGRNINKSFNITEGTNPFDGFNHWALGIADGEMTLLEGNHGIKEIFSLPLSADEITAIGFLAGKGCCLEVRDINLSCRPVMPDEMSSFEIDRLPEYFNDTDDPFEGYWTVFDRELEESLLKMGGDYQLACVREGDNYFFIYIEGASVNRKNWQPGDIKAVLSPTPFPGIYNVKWYDAGKEILSHEIKAQRGEGTTLTIQFPYQQSKLRLRKLTF